MTRWHGRMGRGAGRAVRIEKREEAQERDAVSTYNAEIGRVVREHNVSPRTARHVVNAERRLSARKRELAAQRQGVTGTGAYGGGQCLYVLDGHDTDGTPFHWCTVHGSVEISADAPCGNAP